MQQEPSRFEHARQRLFDGRVLLILRLRQGGDLDGLAQAAVSAGVQALEVTIDTPGATSWVEGFQRRRGSELAVGLGTVRRPRDLEVALAAAPDFVVSPTVDTDVISDALAANVLPVPGALTPTEIVTAHDAGAPLVKLFPAAAMGPNYLKQVLAPMSDVRLLPVGGVDASNAGELIAAGAAAVAVGSAVVAPSDAGAVELADVEARLRVIVERVQAASSVRDGAA